MKSQSKFLFSVILGCVICLLASCLVPTAKENKYQEVVIYSDCLSPKDLPLFKKFKKKYNIHVKIIYLPTDSIFSKLKRDKFNATADLIIFKSLYNAFKAEKTHLFNPVHSWKLEELIHPNYTSKEKSWYGIGIDPYIFICEKGRKNTPEKYAQLIEKENLNKWSTNLITFEDLLPLFEPSLRYKKRGKVIQFYQDFNEYQIYLGTEFEDIIQTGFCLTKLSYYVKNISVNDSLAEQYEAIFPNQNTTGSYFDMHCAGIVKHARNFENAKLLLEHIATIQFNEKINQKWKTIPISLHSRIHPYEYQNSEFNSYKGPVSKQIVNYTYLKKMLTKERKEKSLEIYTPPIIIDSIKIDSVQINQQLPPDTE